MKSAPFAGEDILIAYALGAIVTGTTRIIGLANWEGGVVESLKGIGEKRPENGQKQYLGKSTPVLFASHNEGGTPVVCPQKLFSHRVV